MYHSVLSTEVRKLAQHWQAQCQDYIFGKPSDFDIDKYNKELRDALRQLEILDPAQRVISVGEIDYCCEIELINGDVKRIPLITPVLPIKLDETGLYIQALDFAIKNPTTTECGRFDVSPDYYGFVKYGTGGGHECWRLDCTLGTRYYQMILTDGNGGIDGELQTMTLLESSGPDDELGTVTVMDILISSLP
jgi:hypothetical protein